MKYFLIVLSGAIFCASLLYGAWTIADYRAEIARLKAEIGQLQAEGSPSGGMEGPVIEPLPVPAGTYVFPVAAEDYIEKTSPFGTRTSPILGIERKHYGLDIAAVWRAEIVAVADGVIVDHYPPKGTPHPNGGHFSGHDIYGGYVEILHDDGAVSKYGHLYSTRAMIGRRVTAGTPIGRQGRTGRATGDHLHFEMLIDGEPVNPLLYLPEVRP